MFSLQRIFFLIELGQRDEGVNMGFKIFSSPHIQIQDCLEGEGGVTFL